MYSQYDGDSSVKTISWLEQEEYRRWLVDCHKASYLPTCLSGGKKNILTTEPAVVLSDRMGQAMNIVAPRGGPNGEGEEIRKLMKRQKAQKGGILHRQRFNI
jgi:hypothetical protein